jgi:hypothetical protein
MRASSRLLLFVATIQLAACSTPPPEPPPDAEIIIGACTLPYVGDPNAPMEVNVVALGPNGKLIPIEDGSDIPLMLPPQGGRVVFAGVRARNVNPCGVRLAGALRDPVSKQVRLDNRIINLQIATDGYGQSDIGEIFTFANISACPNQWSDQDLMDAPYELTVSLTDVDGRKVTKVLQVTPRCNEPGQISGCVCICPADYVLGMPCEGLPDGGSEDASSEPSDASGN